MKIYLLLQWAQQQVNYQHFFFIYLSINTIYGKTIFFYS